MNVRVRFAPSPTGFLHLGSARTALFNFLFARSQKGVFILRIEDTDKERSKKEFEEDILDSLKWLKLDWDEDIIRQSERIDLYKSVIKELIEKNFAYYCFCSKEELELRRQEQLSRGEVPKYSGVCRNIPLDQALKRKEKENYVIRLKVPDKIVKFKDFLRGEIKHDFNLSGDFVIAKKEDEPLYVLANTIDDHYQGITHIIRGEEFISTTPKQILIYEYLDWKPPVFVHLPLVLGQDRSKLSKRHGAKSIKEYREEGYLPEAILNFVVLLGWHPEGDKEIVSLEEMIKEFKIEKLNKSPTVFNPTKLNYLNKQFLKVKHPDELLSLFDFSQYGSFVEDKLIAKNNVIYTKEKILKIIELGKERAITLKEILTSVDFLFVDFDYSKDLLLWKNSSFEKIKENLIKIKEKLSLLSEEEFISNNIKEILENLSDNDKGPIFWPLRVALSGKDASPPPFDLAEIFGKNKTIELINKAINKL